MQHVKVGRDSTRLVRGSSAGVSMIELGLDESHLLFLQAHVASMSHQKRGPLVSVISKDDQPNWQVHSKARDISQPLTYASIISFTQETEGILENEGNPRCVGN